LQAHIYSGIAADVAQFQVQGEAIKDNQNVKIDLNLTVDKPHNLSELVKSLRSQTSLGPHKKGVHLVGSVSPFFFSPPSSSGEFQISNLQLESIGPSLAAAKYTLTAELHPQEKIEWIESLGQIVHLTSSARLAWSEENAAWQFDDLQGSIQSTQIEALWKGEWLVGKQLSLTEPLKLSYIFTPELLALFKEKSASFTSLKYPTKMHLHIQPFVLPLIQTSTENFSKQLRGELFTKEIIFNNGLHFEKLKMPWQADLNAHHFEVSLESEISVGEAEKGKLAGNISLNKSLQTNGWISLDKLMINTPNCTPCRCLLFEQILAEVESQDLSKAIHFNITAHERGQQEQTYPLLCKGEVVNFLTPDNQFNPKELSLNLEIKSERLPASFLCQVTGVEETIKNKLEVLLGDTVDTFIRAQLHQMDGPLEVKLQGKNGRIHLNAKITEGILTLRDPFEAEIAVTPLLAETVLQDVIPVLGGVVSAENPVSIHIEPDGFRFPLKNFDLDQIRVAHGKIDLGKMSFSNKGELSMVFDLLRPDYQEELTVWFTPLYFKMQDGLISLARMDMLFMNRYPFAIWGKVNARKDKVDMRIGVTGIALSRALNLPNLDSQEMLQLPLKGKTGEASIDKAKAAARISALVAQQQGTAPGILLGAVLDLAGGSLLEDKPPAPTTQPFPWEKE
jgi:hypothetical protein